jgi:hypothetical protein
MSLFILKPRVGSRCFCLIRKTLHCINLSRHNKHAEIVSYLRTLDKGDVTEVYGRTIAWMADNVSYEEFISFRRRVWSSGLYTSHVKSKEEQNDA